MLLSHPSSVPALLRSPRTCAALLAGIAAVGGYFWYSLTRVRPTPYELETARRNFLASSGRIVDGSITETRWADHDSPDNPLSVPETLIYTYSIGGVTYECAQDVTPLPDRVRHVRTDLPIQVRFDPRNPGDSIVVAENWSGLRLANADPTSSSRIPFSPGPEPAVAETAPPVLNKSF